MPTIDLTPEQCHYLQAAVGRDLEHLEEMTPWEVDEQMDAWLTEIAFGRAVLLMLKGGTTVEVV